MKIISLEQQSEDWLAFRQSKIGASEAPTICGASEYETREDLLLRKLGQKTPIAQNMIMRMGIKFEPVARSMFCFEKDVDVDPVVGQHDEHDFMIASFDGYADGVILEIKLVGKANIEAIKEKGEAGIKEAHKYQLAQQWLVSGAKTGWYVCYTLEKGYGKIKDIIYQPITRDDLLCKVVLEEEIKFWAELTERRKTA